MSIKELYNRMGKNFMTPNVIKWEQVSDRVIELSKGIGMYNEDVFGVSEFLYHRETNTLESTKRGDLFYNKKEALKYYTLLKFI